MSKVLICWEDKYFIGLERCLRRCVNTGEGQAIQLYFDSARGLGGFEHFVKSDWPKAASKGLLKSGGPVDFLFCIADADRARACCAEIQDPPREPQSTQSWVEQAEQIWVEKLRKAAPVHSERVQGVFFRWNKESLLIAAHDMENLICRLGFRANEQREKLGAHLRACSPNPLGIQDSSFSDVFRKPGKCLEGMSKAAGLKPPSKNDPQADDMLKDAALNPRYLSTLQARVPDLRRLAERIKTLS